MKYIKESVNSRFRDNFFSVAKANIYAQAFPLLAIPFLSRLYTPEDYGVAGIFAVLVAMSASISTLRFEWLIPNSDSDKEAGELAIAGLVATAINFLITLCAIYVFFGPFQRWEPFEKLGYLIYLAPIAVVGISVQYIFQSWYVRKAALAATGKAKVQQSLSSVLSNLLLGFFKFGATGLILSSVVSAWVGLRVLIKGAPDFRFILRSVQSVNLSATFSKHKNSVAVSTGVSTVNSAFAVVLPILISTFYGTKEYGIYALVMRIASVPSTLFSTALAQSFWAEAAIIVKTDKHLLRYRYLRTVKILTAFSVVPLLVMLFSPLYLDTLLGKQQWHGASMMLLCVAPQIVGSFIFSATNHLTVYNRQDLQLYSDLLGILLATASIIVSSKLEVSVNIALFLASASLLCGYLLRFFLHLRANRDYCEI